ncbi:MAG: hypothetical protein LBD58_08025 [Treponema sp.]|nr:hypothetical protein [Treponema sp.]
MSGRREIFEAHCRRYQRAGKKGKGNVLDEAAETTGLNREHLAHALASYGKKRAAKREARHGCGKREQGKREGEIAKVSPGVCGHIDARLGGSRADVQSETKFPQLLPPLIRGCHRPSYRVERAWLRCQR